MAVSAGLILSNVPLVKDLYKWVEYQIEVSKSKDRLFNALKDEIDEYEKYLNEFAKKW